MGLKEIYEQNALIPKRYQKEIALRPSQNDEQVFIELDNIKNNAKQFVDAGKNLLICSNSCGNGKTTFSIKILKSYIEQVSNYSFKNDTPAIFINVNSFLNRMKLAITDPDIKAEVTDIEKKILSAKLVVFDDIADKTLSEYDMNTLYYWIDYRTSNLKSCIYTTNQLPSQLSKTFNGKVYSRVVNYSDIKVITDGDNRGVNK